MRQTLISIAASIAIAACASHASPPAKSGGDPAAAPASAPATTGAVLELGEMTVFDGAQAMLKLHADGTTELGRRTGSTQVAWNPGPVISSDGTFAMNGEPVLKVTPDGKILDVKKNEALPLTVATDSISIVDGAKTFTIALDADGKLTFGGSDVKPDVAARIDGADTPGKRRAVLVFVALMLAGQNDHSAASPPAAASTPAVAP